jgi:3'-phosphoadenosine 5'-phosphosulfate sulfotransferase (PAPS reductase)/FAD synthetase
MSQVTWNETELQQAAAELEGKGPEATLRWAFDHFATEEIALACSFGAEDVALVDMVSKVRPGARVFYLDTNVLFPETYALIDKVQAKYDVKLEQFLPLLTLEEQAAQKGEALWTSDPDGCCGIRKVEPLKRALGTMDAWITGIRREQKYSSCTRPRRRMFRTAGSSFFGLAAKASINQSRVLRYLTVLHTRSRANPRSLSPSAFCSTFPISCDRFDPCGR